MYQSSNASSIYWDNFDKPVNYQKLTFWLGSGKSWVGNKELSKHIKKLLPNQLYFSQVKKYM